MLDNNSSFRAFFAIAIPENIKAIITTAIKPLHSDLTLQQIKWVKPHNLHITICFLGNISQQQYQCIDQKIKSAITSINSFSIELTKLQPFPTAEKFHSISLETKPGTAITTLALTIEHNVKACGIQIKNRPFIPHLTLGRIKDQNTMKSQFLDNIKLPTMSLDVIALKLFKSESHQETTSAESVYTVMNTYNLNKKI